jgi:SAM-dependent methyltransferase
MFPNSWNKLILNELPKFLCTGMTIKNIIKGIVPPKLRPVVKRTALQILYYGKAYHCPVCNSNVRLLNPLGYDLPVIFEKQIAGSGLRNAMCPVCESSDRVRLLYLFLREKTNLFNEPLKLLHIAPEKPLTNLFIKQKTIDYLTADLNPEQVMVKMDITAIQYPDNSFDAILCNHVLEHIPDDRKAMSELHRILKSGGWAILQIPVSKVLEKTYEDSGITSPMDREKHFGQKDHVRIYGKDYTLRLKEAGFKVDEYIWINDPHLRNDGNRFGLNKEETVFYCLKVKY